MQEAGQGIVTWVPRIYITKSSLDPPAAPFLQYSTLQSVTRRFSIADAGRQVTTENPAIYTQANAATLM